MQACWCLSSVKQPCVTGWWMASFWFPLKDSHSSQHRNLSAVVHYAEHDLMLHACVSCGTLCFISFPVIDLLAALNMSHHITGVSRLQSAGSVTYRIRPRAPYLSLPREYSNFLYSNLHSAGMGVHLVGHQSSSSRATLFSLSSGSSPILQIISSTLNNTLRLDYQAGGGGGQGLTSFHFPRRNPFSREEWVQLAVSLETDRVAFFVDCQEAVVVQIKSKERINLELPQDVAVTLGSTPGKKDSKFSVSFSYELDPCAHSHTETRDTIWTDICYFLG